MKYYFTQAKKIYFSTIFLLFCTSVLFLPFEFPHALAQSPQSSFEVGFSPRGDSLQLIIKAIQESKKSLHIASYYFTSKQIANELVAALDRGVSIQIVADKQSNMSKYSVLSFLADNGVAVRLNNNYKILHHKFIVIDEMHIETGSFNFTDSAYTKNAENVLLIWNDKKLAEKYKEHWDLLWEEASDIAMYK